MYIQESLKEPILNGSLLDFSTPALANSNEKHVHSVGKLYYIFFVASSAFYMHTTLHLKILRYYKNHTSKDCNGVCLIFMKNVMTNTVLPLIYICIKSF